MALKERKSVLMITQENQKRASRRQKPAPARHSQATQMSLNSRDLQDVYLPADGPLKAGPRKRPAALPEADGGNNGNSAVTETDAFDSQAQF